MLSRAVFWRLIKKLGLINESDDTIGDQSIDRILPFDEYPPCEMCYSNSITEKLITQDNSRIVECNNCGLWFTSPRINEKSWIKYLKSTADRNIRCTENRFKYGVALTANVKYAFPNWRKLRKIQHDEILDFIEINSGIEIKKIKRIHDVGCGVGFLIQDALSRGIEASGNELNAYACKVMKERFGLIVYNDILPNLNIEPESIDAIIMRDYIEHTYHPLADLKAAHKLLKKGGILYVETFHIDCKKFEELKDNWNMLFWNHVFHFSQNTLEYMIKIAKFSILDVQTSFKNVLIKIVARKV